MNGPNCQVENITKGLKLKDFTCTHNFTDFFMSQKDLLKMHIRLSKLGKSKELQLGL